MTATSSAPKGTQAAGRRLWRSVVDEFEMTPHELELLRQTVAVLDSCETLQAVVAEQGLLVDDRATGATVELRLQRVLLLKLMADLRIPDADNSRAPQRPGSRGAYGQRDAS